MSDESDGPAADLEARIEAASSSAEAADTEGDLDEVTATLDAIEDDLESADLPEPEADEEGEEAEEPSVREQLEAALAEVRSTVEGKRGPYGEDVVAAIEAVVDDAADASFTEAGEVDLRGAVASFASTMTETIGDAPAVADDASPGDCFAALEAAAETVAEAALDPDADAEAIASLLEATDALEDGVDEAETWSDLTVREQLQRQGFYDVLDHYKDFPPEWSALKVHEQEGNVDMVLLALESFDSGFMEEHCLDALRRMADPAAVEAMVARAEKRDQPAIEVLGKIGSDEPVEMLLEYAENDGNPALQLVTLQALGEIGSEEATQTVADRLVHDEERVRSQAARTLGLLGDTRAIEPLADTLENDASDVVRGSAAWALNQIGTERALQALEPYADDRAYLVQVEAERAAAATAT